MIGKKLLIVVIMLFTAAGLVWSGGQQEVDPEDVEVPEDIEWVTTDRIGNPEAPITLTYEVDYGYSIGVDDEARAEYLEERAREWVQANPHVKLEQQVLAGTQDEIVSSQLEQAATGTAPDFAMIDGQWIPLFYDYLAPLDDYVSEEEQNDWFDWSLDTMIDPDDGQLKSLWLATNAVGLWYRRDLIDPPQDWDEFIEAGHELMDSGFDTGILAIGHEEQISYGAVLPMFYGLGGNLVDDDGNPVYGEGSNREAMVEVMGFWHRAAQEGVVPDRILDITGTGDMVAEAEAEMNNAMFLGGSWFLSRMQDVMGEDIENWAFTFTPQRDAELTGETGQVPGGWNWAVFTEDEEKQELIVDYLMHVYTGREGMADFTYIGGYTPLRNIIFEEDERFSENRWQQSFAEVIDAGRTRPGVQAYGPISLHLQEAWENVILGRRSPEEAVDEAFEASLRQVQ